MREWVLLDEYYAPKYGGEVAKQRVFCGKAKYRTKWVSLFTLGRAIFLGV